MKFRDPLSHPQVTVQEQYKKMLSEIEIFKAAIKKHSDGYPPDNVHWKVYRAVEEGLITKLEELQDEAILYEKKHGLRTGD
jgi:hypothetical protein